MAAHPKDSQVSLRLPTALKEQMETYAEMTGRTKSHVAMEALGEYLVTRLPQIEDLKEAIAAADRSEFATDAEVEAVYRRFAAPEQPKSPRTSRPKRAGATTSRPPVRK